MAKKLRRSTDERLVGGVCGGIAEYTGVDVVIVRLVVAAAILLGVGVLLPFYVLAWILIPNARSTT